MKERDFAIDVVKFLAVFLIINSHADIMYPRFSMLATGGAIGDCLFLFCSGFTLFWGEQKSFDYPSVFAATLFTHLIFCNSQFQILDFSGGEFVMAIMVYYIFLYYIRKYAINRMPLLLLLVAIVSLVVYIVWFPYKYETSSNGLYGITTNYRWIPYFAAMLLGAFIGLKRKKMKYQAWWDFAKLLICVAMFYSIQFAAKMYRPVAPWQVVTLLPLMGIVVYLYKWCNCELIRRVYQNSVGNAMIMTVGGLCLESYLIQGALFTDKMNFIWPLNLFVIILIILFCSYVVRCMARLFAQTFRTEDYEWRKIISIY